MRLPALLALAISLLALPCSQARTWTSADGRELEAEFISQNTETREVTIKNAAGKEFTIKIGTLSEEDQKWLADLATAEEAERAAKLEEKAKLAGTTVKMTSDGDLPTSYHVYYPQNYGSKEKHPLLIMFSPGGNGRGILNSVKAACDELGIIAAGCDTFRNGADEEEFSKRFTDLLPHLEAAVEHDPAGLYMGGFSGGGLRSFDFSGQFDRDWAGILSFGGWMGKDGEGLDTAKKMRVAIVNGDEDKAANHYIERDKGILEGRRCEVKVYQFPGGHAIAPPEVTLEALKWILEE